MDLFLQSLISGIMTGGVYAIIALGLTLIFGVMRIINMAHGEFLMIGMYISYFSYTLFHIDPFISIVISAPLTFLLGVVIYRFVVSRSQNEENSLILTAGLSLVLANTALLLWSPDYRHLKVPYGTEVVKLGNISVSLPMLISFLITIAITLLLYWFLNKTDLGLAIRASAQESEAATVMGINVKKIAMITFGIGAAFASISGSLLAPALYAYPTIGTLFLVKAFVVVVLGGMGSVEGALIGGIILGVTESLGSVYISTGMTDAFGLILFLLILLFRPSGLFGTATR
ncbi:MAG: branched-chain amino acid ABC transporter permease [Bacillaceae bacterium]|nr:branched-chain amino acid ABC transporter permease [Bacillaceae bacterium]